jgi:hypothetical protein
VARAAAGPSQAARIDTTAQHVAHAASCRVRTLAMTVPQR